MKYILLLISYLLKTYGAVQEERDVLSTPLIWQSDVAKTILMSIWVVLLGLGSYLVYMQEGMVLLVFSLIIYFLIAPALFGKLIQNFMNRKGF